MSSLEKCLFSSSTHFLIVLYMCVCVCVCIELHEMFVYFGDNPMSDVCCLICKYFLLFWEFYLFILFMISYAVQKHLSLIRSHVFIVFIFITLGGGSKKTLQQFMAWHVLPVFSSNSFIVSGFTFRSLIHFEFYFCV